MTAAVALPLQWPASGPRVAPDRGEDPTSAQASFGQLLNALLPAQSSLTDGAADLTGGGGTIADMPERFEAAPLLSASELHPADPTAQSNPQLEANPAAVPPQTPPTPPRSLGSSAQLGQALRPLSDVAAPRMQISAAMAIEPLAAISAFPVTAPGAPAEPKSSPWPAPSLRPLPALPGSAQAEQTNAADPGASFDRTGGSASRFGLRLLQSEHGPVLVMHLPKMTAEERVQLEAQIARLFEAFGQRKHKLVLRELAGG